MKKRVVYVGLTIILLLVEVLIALFVHDRIVRPYIGDMLVVVVIYTFIRSWIPDSVRLLPVYVFLFATGVEILQYFNLVELLGGADNPFLRILLGTSFDVKDIICYAAGCVLVWAVERRIRHL
ncbi:MAG: DUF2809 domain-containing protein [Lachnospiraceae bacterium]|nr:DUF2809 domain-containing protein [Lachnospiraceae bacterium]MDE7203939.1 DUF2809 domain-containing protein [Lachnospiraceae bacterium]